MAVWRSNTQPCIRPSCHIACTGVALKWLKPWKSETSNMWSYLISLFIHGHRSEFSGWGPGFTQCRIARLWDVKSNDVKHRTMQIHYEPQEPQSPRSRTPKSRVRISKPLKIYGKHADLVHVRFMSCLSHWQVREDFDSTRRIHRKEHVIRHVIRPQRGFWHMPVIDTCHVRMPSSNGLRCQHLSFMFHILEDILGYLGIISLDILELYVYMYIYIYI